MPSTRKRSDITAIDRQARDKALGIIDALYAAKGLTESEAMKLASDVTALHSHRMMFNDSPLFEVARNATNFYCGGFGVTVYLSGYTYGFVYVFCRAMAIARDVASDFKSNLEARGIVSEVEPHPVDEASE